MPKHETKKDKLYQTGGYFSKSIYVTPQDILNYIAKQIKKSMKQTFGFLILCSVLFGCSKPQPEIRIITKVIYRDTCNQDSEFIQKIGQIETGNTDSTIAEGGRGRGRYGIYEICVKGSGMCDLLGYSHADMNTKIKSDHVFWATMGIFCYLYAREYGHYPTYEQLARMWAGGYNAHDKNCTLNYLKKFKEL